MRAIVEEELTYKSMRIIFITICWMMISVVAMAQQYFPVKVDKKWGLMDVDGNLILPPNYDAIGEFKAFGYAVMQKEGRVGLLNKQGEEVVKPFYDDIKVLDSTLFAVMEDTQWKVINLSGELVLATGYDRVQVWQGSILGYMKDQKWGMANAQGSEICRPIYDEIELLQAGYFQTRIADQLGLIRSDGTVLKVPSADELRVYSDEFILFRKEKNWGGINRIGEEVVPAEYNSMVALSDHFIKLVKDKTQLIYSIPAGRIISDDGQFDDFYAFSENHILAKKNRLLGLLDAEGTLELEVRYNEIQTFNPSLYRVRLQGKWGMVAPGDQLVVPFAYDYIAPSDQLICVAKKENHFGIINTRGEELVPFDFDRIELEKNKAKAFIGESLSLYHFDDEGNLKEENTFKEHFTIRIGGKTKRMGSGSFTRLENNYQLEHFEWFYSSSEDRWGLRRLDDGSIQIEPSFDWIRIEREVGMTIVGMEKYEYYDFEWTRFRFEMIYGLVNNEKGLLVTQINLHDVRFSDFDKGYPTARCVFSNGRHGLINRIGKIVKKDYAYIGEFKDGLARMSVKGRLSGSFKKKVRGLDNLDRYLSGIMSPHYMMDYTLYDQDFEDKAKLTCEGCKYGYIDTSGQVMIHPQYTFARDFVNNVGIVEYNNKWGMVDQESNILIPCDYDGLHFLENTGNKIIRVYNKLEKYGLIDTLGQVRVNLQYDEIGAFSDGRLAVKRNGLWGYVDKYGREVIPCRFRRVKNFSEGYAAVQLRRSWGVIDKQGDVTIDFIHKKIGNFKRGLAWVGNNDGYGFINSEGRYIIEPRFNRAFDFEGGIARVIEKGRYGLINQRGEYINTARFAEIGQFDKNGRAIVRYQGQRVRYGVINRKGKVITRHKYKQIQPYKEGMAVVRYKDQYGYIDLQGKMVIGNTFSKASGFSEGRAAVQRNGLCGYINMDGEEVVDFEYSKCLDFEGGKAVVYKGYRQGGIIDMNGNYVIEPSINRLFGFTEGRGLVRDSRYRFYYITEEAKLYEGYYEEAGAFQHGVAVVQSDGRWGIINQKGMEIIPPKYDKIEDFKDGYAKVRIQGFSGLTNLQGELIVQPNYEYISYAGEGLFRVEQGDKIGYFDSDGNWIWSLSD